MTEYKGYQIKVIQDECPISPREDDNLGTMLCFHKRSSFGSKLEVELSRDLKKNDFASWNEVEKHIISKFDVAIILPIYMYEHGSVALSTIPFNDRWDSGQVGYIFISKEKVKKEYSCKRISKQLKERISGYLKSEIETYNLYLNGDIFFYRIEDKEGKEIIPFKFDVVSYFREELSGVKLNDKWGFINKNGEEVIPFKYDDFGVNNFFNNGLAKVYLNGKFGYIDKNGTEYFEEQW